MCHCDTSRDKRRLFSKPLRSIIRRMADEKGNTELTPLQRYMAKHKENPAEGAGEEESSRPPLDAEQRAIEAGVPAMPPPLTEPFGEEVGVFRGRREDISNVVLEPGRFGIRALAYFIDLVIVSVLTSIANFALGMGFFFLPDFLWTGLTNVVNLAVVFIYYGWFYSERGSTPGKMIFNLQVMETGSGHRIGYWRSFFRETVGKFLSGLIFGIGYLIVFFRDDRKALHDLIFDTRVMQRREPRS